MRGDCGVERGIQAGMIRDVDDLTTHVVARSVRRATSVWIDAPSTSRIVTEAPFSARASTKPKPIPLAPPVTTTP